MNIPKDMRKFDLQMAQQGHPLITRAGTAAKFIAYVADAYEDEQLITLIHKRTNFHFGDGKSDGSLSYDLFLAPLGYCQGLPVFAGDMLIGPCGDIVASVDHLRDVNPFGLAKWPSKHPIVETRMKEGDIWDGAYMVNDIHKLIAFANKAIERAIADEDVIPLDKLKFIAKDAFEHHEKFGDNFNWCLDTYIRQYLEGLK